MAREQRKTLNTVQCVIVESILVIGTYVSGFSFSVNNSSSRLFSLKNRNSFELSHNLKITLEPEI